MLKNVGKARFEATNRLIGTFAGYQSAVVEIGSNDASFRSFHVTNSWLTVDKYGEPDIQADLDGPMVQLPFSDASIDLVICTEVLEHLRAGSPLVAEFGRILKPQGVAIISVPNICSLKSRIKMLFGMIPNLAASGDCGHPLGGTGTLVDGSWVAAHVVDFNLSRLCGYLRRGGLHVFKITSVPVTLPFPGMSKPILLPHLPASLADFLLVAARPIAR